MADHDISKKYDRDGYVNAVPILTDDEASHHRNLFEQAEQRIGPLHYKAKMHTILPSAWALATHPSVLDAVEAILGPNILLYDVGYIVKEPGTASFVSWHQDLTFWGLSNDDQVSLWLALSPANAQSGCMRMIPGSHKRGMADHAVHDNPDNVLYQGQTVSNVNEEDAMLCELLPGQATFHHGWTLHASMANSSTDRRIGLNAQYLAPHIRQTKHDLDTAILVRGKDSHGHFKADVPAHKAFQTEAMARWHELNRLHEETQGNQ